MLLKAIGIFLLILTSFAQFFPHGRLHAAEPSVFTQIDTLSDKKQTLFADLFQEGNAKLLKKNQLVKLRINFRSKAASTGFDIKLIRVDLNMPAHGHGMPTKPVIKKLASAQYLVEGVKLQMAGKWLLKLSLRKASGEKVKVEKWLIVK